MTQFSSRICCTCSKEGAQYKCPKCRSPYCSAQCCCEHKRVGCEPLPPTQQATEPQNVAPVFNTTEDSLPAERLQNLRHNPNIRECLNNPHLRQIMSAIDKSSNPTDLIAQAMLEPIFAEFATECLKVVQTVEGRDTSGIQSQVN